MIRWRYVIPRLVLLGALLLALWVGLNPLVRWTMVRMGQSATSAKVEIGRVRTSLLTARLQLSDLRLANPRSPLENLVQADQVTLGLDPDALLRRSFVVREARVSGLRFGTERATSGALDEELDWHIALPHAELGEQCFDRLAEILQQGLLQQAEKLESVRLARELYERWPMEYERMEARIDSLRGRVESMRRLSETVREDPLAGDPLRTLGACQEAARELQAIERETFELRGEVDRLRRQALSDKDAVVRAKERDLATVRETVKLAKLDADAFSDYLLGPELSETVRTVAAWVRWGRRNLATSVDEPQPVRKRGVDVAFGSAAECPDFLIQSLVVDGEARLGGRRVVFQGKVKGITTQPKRYGRPVVLKARIDAGTELALEAVLDHTGATPHDRITVDCPGLEQPERVLGREGRLAVLVSPGSTHVWASLDVTGTQLSGRILVRQEPIKLTPDLAEVPVHPRFTQSLETAMSRVREIRVVVDLSGTLEKPEWGLRSNLGPELAGVLNGLFAREVEARREELAAYVQKQVEGQLAQVEGLIAAKQQALLGKLDLNGTQIGRLNQVIARRLRLPEGVLGKGLPNDLLGEGLPKGILGKGLPTGGLESRLQPAQAKGLPFRL